ncbi:MAG: aminotransferase class III-fold pyridoxal phosphate-dependent enzyme [Dehalococcoidia bacterium]
MTSAYIPMGAFLVSKPIHDALLDLPSDARFMHAYTNSAHPAASAVGLRNLQIFEDEHLVERAAVLGERMSDGIRAGLEGHPHVTNIRNLGLIAGLTLVRNAAANEAYDASEAVGGRVARHLREEREVITRFVGDQLVFAPPLASTDDDIDFLVDAVTKSVRAITE